MLSIAFLILEVLAGPIIVVFVGAGLPTFWRGALTPIVAFEFVLASPLSIFMAIILTMSLFGSSMSGERKNTS